MTLSSASAGGSGLPQPLEPSVEPGVGLGSGVLALICGSAALSERPEGRVWRVARAGVAAGAIAVAGFVVLILIDVLAF